MMRVSDAERREVAQKLREDPERIGPGYLTDGELLDVIAADVGVRASCDDFDAKLMDRLADLIDMPTCTIKRDEQSKNPTTWCVCSKCGALVNAERAVSNATEYLPTRYCPNCGKGRF